MIKLVISDVDGTLIDESEVLSQKAIDMAKYLKERNVLFTIATGRVEYIAEGFVKQLGIEIPYITCNGATIVKGKEVLERNQIDLLPLKQMIEKADTEGLSVIYSIDGYEKVYRFTQWVLDQQRDFDRYHEEHRFTDEEWRTLKVDKITIMDDTLAGCIAEYDKMCSELPEGYGYTRYLDRAVEVVSGGATKANALRSLIAILGIKPEEVLAAGDHQNDIEMVTEAGVGVAVGNATEQLKSVADYVARGHNVDGLFEAVRHFIP